MRALVFPLLIAKTVLTMVEADVLYFEGKYNPDRRFVIHNWTAEDFKSFWDSRPINIKAGDMHECEHAIAVKLTKEIVDREMFKEAERLYREAGADKAHSEKIRERAEMAVLSKELRKPLEDKTITEIRAGEENPITTKLRAEVRAEIEAESKADTKAPSIDNSKAVSDVVEDKPKKKKEFAEANQ